MQEKCTQRGEYRICLVNGVAIRDNLAQDFTMGGHTLVYPFIPDNDIWIEEGLGKRDREATVVHEVNELSFMRKGMSYEEAHKLANKAEAEYRKTTSPITKLQGSETIQKILPMMPAEGPPLPRALNIRWPWKK